MHGSWDVSASRFDAEMVQPGARWANRRNVPVAGVVRAAPGTLVPDQSARPRSRARTMASVRLDTPSLA